MVDRTSKSNSGSFELLKHFRQLPSSSQALIRSFGSHYIAVPLFSTFTSAFLWEQVASKLAVPYFYLGIYPGLALGFYLSAALLRFISLRQLYALGLVAQALPIFALCAFGFTGLLSIAIVGAVWGLLAGLYWAARNLLTLQLTHDAHRDYFYGTDSFLSVTASTVLPLFFGCLIEYRFFWSAVIDKPTAFTILMLILIVVLSLGARGILRTDLGTVSNVSVFVRNAPPVWHRSRKLIFMFGTGMAALSFIPAVLILAHFKGQDQLGGLLSCAALVSAAALYRLGRIISTPTHRIRGMMCASFALLGSASLLELGFYDWNVLLFAIVVGFTSPFNWNCINTTLMRSIEACDPRSEAGFAYLVDREAYLDIGRTVGIAVCLLLAVTMSIEDCLTIMPAFGAGCVLIAVYHLKKLSDLTEFTGSFTRIHSSVPDDASRHSGSK